jgi:hypothetical protein
VADASDQALVRALLESGDVLVSTVGPFQRHGEAAVAAAVEAGAIYFDSTGEPPFVRRVFERPGPAAARTGAALLAAFGNDYVPGMLAGALAFTEVGVATAKVHTGYFIVCGGGQGFSKGTLNSLAGVLLEPMYSCRDGALTDEHAGARYCTFQLAGKARPAVSSGATEPVRAAQAGGHRRGVTAARGGYLPGLVRSDQPCGAQSCLPGALATRCTTVCSVPARWTLSVRSVWRH